MWGTFFCARVYVVAAGRPRELVISTSPRGGHARGILAPKGLSELFLLLPFSLPCAWESACCPPRWAGGGGTSAASPQGPVAACPGWAPGSGLAAGLLPGRAPGSGLAAGLLLGRGSAPLAAPVLITNAESVSPSLLRLLAAQSVTVSEAGTRCWFGDRKGRWCQLGSRMARLAPWLGSGLPGLMLWFFNFNLRLKILLGFTFVLGSLKKKKFLVILVQIRHP